jgi:hypothetical protein
MKNYAFDVYLNKKKIDTVFYNEDYFKGFKNLNEVLKDIKKSLVEHDGYCSNIIVKY